MVNSATPALRDLGGMLRAAREDVHEGPANAWLVYTSSLRARRRTSVLGSAWFLVPMAVALAIAYYLHGTRLVGLSGSGAPYTAYVACGMVLWLAFSDGLQLPYRYLAQARPLLTRSRLPHETWLGAAALECAHAFVLRFAALVLILVMTGEPLRWTLAVFPAGALALAVLGFAIGLLVAPAGLVSDDVGPALAVIAALWFLLTPVLYAPPDSGHAARLVELNPVTTLLVEARSWVIGGPGADGLAYAGIAAGSVLLLAVAWACYRIARPHLVALL